MQDIQHITQVKSLIEKANDILIVTHKNPTFDSMGSALSLYLGLKALGKTVTVTCPTPMTVEFSNFVGANKLTDSLTKKNFVISLDYEDGSIEKVSYNIEGNKFNLIIEPRPGFEGFSQEKVSYSTAGTNVDTIIAVDTKHLGGLGSLYEEDKELFATHPIINIDSHGDNAKYGSVNIVSGAGTTAELVLQFLTALGVTISEDVATNILHALYESTYLFSKNVTAQTFEAAAICVRNGGKYKSVATHKEEPVVVASDKSTSEEVQVKPQTNPPEEWLKPKIYKSSSSLL